MASKALDFEHGNVYSLFYKLLIPTLVGTLTMAAVTTIDGIFIGQGVGAAGVAAVNIAVPIYQIMGGVYLMIAVGCSVVASIHVSQKDIALARVKITQALLFTVFVAALINIIGFSFPHQVAKLLGASETLMPQVVDYMVWVLPSFLFQVWAGVGLFVIRLDGAPRYAMWCNVIPATLNAFLDWLFIFPLGMGVKGAAIATSISMSFGGLMAMVYLFFFAKDLKVISIDISGRGFISWARNIAYQCKIGSSTLLGELTLAVLIYVGNLTFMKYLGDTGVGAFGIACYYMPFFFMIGNAVAQSAQPIISYNYGIGRWKEIKMASGLMYVTSLVMGVIVTLLFIFIPDKLVALFVDTHSDAGVVAINGFPYLAVGIISFILNVSVIGYYQSIEQVKSATLFVCLRGFLFLIPCFILLPQFLHIHGIWLAMPMAELLTMLVIIGKTLLRR